MASIKRFLLFHRIFPSLVFYYYYLPILAVTRVHLDMHHPGICTIRVRAFSFSRYMIAPPTYLFYIYFKLYSQYLYLESLIFNYLKG